MLGDKEMGKMCLGQEGWVGARPPRLSGAADCDKGSDKVGLYAGTPEPLTSGGVLEEVGGCMLL